MYIFHFSTPFLTPTPFPWESQFSKETPAKLGRKWSENGREITKTNKLSKNNNTMQTLTWPMSLSCSFFIFLMCMGWSWWFWEWWEWCVSCGVRGRLYLSPGDIELLCNVTKITALVTRTHYSRSFQITRYKMTREIVTDNHVSIVSLEFEEKEEKKKRKEKEYVSKWRFDHRQFLHVMCIVQIHFYITLSF